MQNEKINKKSISKEFEKKEKENNKESEIKNKIKIEIEDKIEELKMQNKETTNKYIRLYSEFENFKKRNEREKSNIINSANEEIIKKILPVIDDFKRALKSLNENKLTTEGSRGIDLIYNKLNNILNIEGLKKITTKIGDEFDDEKHEVIVKSKTKEKKLKGKIIKIIEEGYIFKNKILKFTKIIIGI